MFQKTNLSKFIIILLIQIFSNNTLYSQIECGTTVPEGITLLQAAPYGEPSMLTSPTTVRHIELAIHIVQRENGTGGLSNVDVSTAYSQLLNAYSYAKISFEIVSSDTINSDLYYEINNVSEFYELVQVKRKSKMLNIYFVGDAPYSGRAEDIPGRALVVKNAVATNGTTLPHEVGHCFDLYHTHEAAFGYERVIRVDTTGCTANCGSTGDLLCDTQAEPYNGGDGILYYVNTNCEYTGNFTDECGKKYISEPRNYMSYGRQCRNKFSDQQIDRMHYALENKVPDLIQVTVYAKNIIAGSNVSGSTLTLANSIMNSGDSLILLDGNQYEGKTNHERFTNYQGIGNFKHHNWNDIFTEFKLKEDFIVNRTIENGRERDANFLPLSSINKVQNQLTEFNNSNSYGYIEFKDPWYLLSPDNQPNNFIQFSSPHVPTGAYNQTTGGVFLNQEIAPNKPYYSVRVPEWQDINLPNIGLRRFYFQNWSANPPTSAKFQNANSLETGVVFTDINALVTANYKVHLGSNYTEGFSSNGQRKLTRTTDNSLHLVYESLGNIYYTKSTDNGSNWSKEKLVCESCASPSIDSNRDTVTIAYKQLNEIKISELANGNFIYDNSFTPSEFLDNSQVVIASGRNYKLIAWRASTNRIKVKYLYREQATNYQWTWSNEINVPQHASSMLDPTISKSDLYQTSEHEKKLFFAYQESTGSSSFISYYPLEFVYNGYTNYALSFYEPYYINVSSGSGYNRSENPSISVKNNIPFISFKGEENIYFGGNNLAVARSLNSSTFFNTGNNILFTNTASRINGTDGSVMAWTEGNTVNSKYVRYVNGSYGSQSLLDAGYQVQLTNGNDFNSMKALIFNTLTLPHSIAVNSISLPKDNLENKITYGRKAVVVKRELEFVYSLNDGQLDDENVQFISRHDTLPIPTANELNSAIQTNNFSLNNSSKFKFSISYYVVKDEIADSILTSNDEIDFKVELVKSSNGQVVGAFDKIKFKKKDAKKFKKTQYQVNCSGIESGEYYLRLVANVNGDAKYYLANVQNYKSSLEKENFENIRFNGSTTPLSFKLEQNYPNPFNPVTKIKYQIPNTNFVTLKVFDILGREVATLVNEQEDAGIYEINFDASKLSSGVYIYKLNAGNYSTIKKMIIVR
jgi:hypothetical protein